jgi:FAD-dependent oxidoreductase
MLMLLRRPVTMKKNVIEVQQAMLQLLSLCMWILMVSPPLLHVVARPPESPVQCGDGNSSCVIKSTYGVWPDREDCVAAVAAFPTSERELVDAVASAVRDGRKVKVVSPWAHSIPKLACPGGDDGLVISTARYNTRVAVDAGRRTAEAEAGVDLRQLVDAAARYGLALPYMPYWGGVSVAGLISTGAHGSSLFRKGGAVHEYVLALRLVVPAPAADGYACVLVLNSSRPDEFDAAKVALGVLGAISTVIRRFEHNE